MALTAQGGTMNKHTRSLPPFCPRSPQLSHSYGFTLVEILVAITILAIGILAISQTTVLGMKTTSVIKDNAEAREVLAKGLEILKLLPYNDPLLTNTCTAATLDDTTTAFYADSSNIIGKTIGRTVYDVYWNVAANVPEANFKTIRMAVFKKSGRRLIEADYVKWR